MKKYMCALLIALLLFGCTRTAPPTPECSGRFDERLQRCVEYSDSVFSSASLYEGKYVCFWGTLASRELLTMPSTSGSRVQVHPSWGINAPPTIGNCTRALANICGTFSSAGGIYQLLDAQSIGLDTGDCAQPASGQPSANPVQSPQTPANNSTGSQTDSPPAPPAGSAANQPSSGSAGNSGSNSPPQPPSGSANTDDTPPPPPSDSSDMPPLPPS